MLSLMARSRGNVEQLPSGALRARVYAGVDPVSNRRHNLTEIIEPGPKAGQRAAGALSARMPARPGAPPDPVERAKSEPSSPYKKIAAKIRLDTLPSPYQQRGPRPAR